MTTEGDKELVFPVVATITLRGVSYPVTCDGYGVFRTTIEDHDLSSRELRDLITQADRVPRRKVAVEFWQVNGVYEARDGRIRPGEIRHGYATGFHATNTEALLLDIDGQRKGAMSSSKVHNAVRATPSELHDIDYLLETQASATQAVREWISEHEIDLHDEVRAALTAAGGSDE